VLTDYFWAFGDARWRWRGETGGDRQTLGRVKPARLTTKWKVHPMEPPRNFPLEPGEISLDDWRERVLEQRDEARWVLAAERRAREAAHQDPDFNFEVPQPPLPEPQWGREHKPLPWDPSFDPGILMPGDSLPTPMMPSIDNVFDPKCRDVWKDIEGLGAAISDIETQIKSLHKKPMNEYHAAALDDWLTQLEEKRKEMHKKQSLNQRYCSS